MNAVLYDVALTAYIVAMAAAFGQLLGRREALARFTRVMTETGFVFHTVALVVFPGYDYHWYRLDSDGMWSHKPGRTPARNTDNSLQPIANPELADRGPYTEFCGYFTVCRCEVRIDGPN